MESIKLFASGVGGVLLCGLFAVGHPMSTIFVTMKP